MANKFQVHCSLTAFGKSDDDNPLRIGGIATTDELDQQGEEIVQSGLDFSPFLNRGWFNDNHGQKVTDVVGYPTGAKFVRKGSSLPNGRRANRNGWWVEGYLVNTPKGRELHQLAGALEGTPRQLGFSIEGSIAERDRANRARVTKAVVKNVAVTHCPVNVGTEMYALAKALTAGSETGSPARDGGSAGDGAPLRPQSLEGGKPYDDEDDTEDEATIKSEVAHDFKIMDLHEHVARHTEAIRDLGADIEASTLTKAEARVIVRASETLRGSGVH